MGDSSPFIVSPEKVVNSTPEPGEPVVEHVSSEISTYAEHGNQSPEQAMPEQAVSSPPNSEHGDLPQESSSGDEVLANLFIEKMGDSGKLKCTLCMDRVFDDNSKAKSHVIACHLGLHLLKFKPGTPDERNIPLCIKGCAPKAHHHCITCTKTMRKSRLLSHISVCAKKSKTSGVGKKRPLKDVPSVNPPPPKMSKNVEKKVQCDQCGESMYKRNLIPHKVTAHSIFKKSISAKRFHNGICVDASQGIYLVNQSGYSGLPNPIHVQKRVVGQQALQCSSERCSKLQCVAGMSALTSFECTHLQSIAFITAHAENVILHEKALDELVGGSRIKEESKAPCMHLKRNAEGNQQVFVAGWVCSTKTFISVWTGEKNSWAQLGRVLVTFDPSEFSLVCSCSHSSKIGCLHKTVGKWYLQTTVPEVFRSPRLSNDDLRLCANNESSAMAAYIFENKKIPFTLPSECVKEKCVLNVVCPSEEMCCDVKLESTMVSQNGRVYSRFGIKENIAVWVKKCIICKTTFWYHETKDGIFNYDNHTFITYDFLEWLRSSAHEHTAIGREVAALNGRYKCNMNDDHVRKAFFKYISLLDLDDSFNCVLCGHHPVILTFDTIRKTSFRLSQLDSVDNPDGVVDCEKYWDDVSKACLDESLGGVSTGKIQPSLGHWAPFIPRKSRGETVYSSEHLKGTDNTENEYLRSISEEHLEDLFNFADIKKLKEVCESCGISTNNKSKGKLVEALKSAVESAADIDKLFFKVWQGSGGTLTATCPHGVVYAFKSLFKAESARDVRDILLSLSHAPNITISDVPHLVASIVNRSVPNFFSPHKGCVAEPTESNIEDVKKGRFQQLSFPNLDNRFAPARTGLNLQGSVMQPISLLSRRWSLCDKFHQGNSKNPASTMRRTELIKELDGVVTETAEQLNNYISKKTYFLDSMSPIHHQLMLKLVLAERNHRKNEIVIKDLKGLLSYGTLVMDEYGRQCITPGLTTTHDTQCNSGAPELLSDLIPDDSLNVDPACSLSVSNLSLRSIWSSPPYVDVQTAKIPVNSPFSFGTLEDDLGKVSCLGSGEYLSGEVMDMLLFSIASKLFEDGIRTVVLSRCILHRISEDATLETLIPECTGADYLVSASYFSHHWALIFVDVERKRICYLDPKESYMPKEKIQKDLNIMKNIVWFNILKKPREVSAPHEIAGWTEVTRSNFLEIYKTALPSQSNSVDCGVYVAMFFTYIARNARFDFSDADIPVIRQWLASLLIRIIYEDMSPYILWFMLKLPDSYLGNIRISDAKFVDEIEQLNHVKCWIETNVTKFSEEPIYPTVLSCSEEEQREAADTARQGGDSYVNLIPKLTFSFLNNEDFKHFMEFVNKFGWLINVVDLSNNSYDNEDEEIAVEVYRSA